MKRKIPQLLGESAQAPHGAFLFESVKYRRSRKFLPDDPNVLSQLAHGLSLAQYTGGGSDAAMTTSRRLPSRNSPRSNNEPLGK
jgi:hypothetical protein